MLRWPHDKPIAEADTLDALKPLLAELGGRRREAGTLHAVIARRPKPDAAIQESPGA